MTKTASYSTEFRSGYVIEGSTVEVRDSYKDTVIGGQAQKQSIMGAGAVIILLTPAPIIDPFPA